MNLPCGLPDTRDESQHLRELLDHNTDWIWEVDAQGRYTYVSRMVTAMLGYPPEQVLGKTPFDFMPPAEARRVGQAFGAIVAEQRPFAGLVNRNQRADGSIVVLETSGVPLFDTFSVMVIRWREKRPLFVGDTCHFSHRLLKLGLSVRQTVIFIYVVTLCVGVSAILIPELTLLECLLVLMQEVLIFGLITLLMAKGNHLHLLHQSLKADLEQLRNMGSHGNNGNVGVK